MRGKKKPKEDGKFLFNYSPFIKIPAQTASNTSMRVFIRAMQDEYPVPQNIIFTWSWAGHQTGVSHSSAGLRVT